MALLLLGTSGIRTARAEQMQYHRKMPKTGCTYLWYPGQLAAYKQEQLKRESAARCVNVGYPGVFFRPVPHAFFKTTVNLSKTSTLTWTAPGTSLVRIDGKTAASGNRVEIGKGRHEIVIEVTTRNQLPCIIVCDGTVATAPGAWQSSLDGKSWTLAESSERYGNPAVVPDSMPENIVALKPETITTLNDGKAITDRIVRLVPGEPLLVDFHEIELGEISFYAKGNGTIKITVGESIEEASDPEVRKMEQRELLPIKVPEHGGTVTVPSRALRYAVLESNDEVELSAITLHAQVWPVKDGMTFECDDPGINRLFAMSRATLLTSMHSFYLDGVKRDCLPWAMDAMVSTFAGDYLFRDKEVSRNSISIALTPPNPRKSDLGVTDYPLHALYGIRQYLQAYGDSTILLQYKDRIIQMMDLYTSLTDARGFFPGTAGTAGYIPGWDTKNGPDSRGIAAYPQMMLFGGYRLVADWAEDCWKDASLADTYRRQAEKLRSNIMTCFWDAEQGAFINGTRNNGQPDKRISYHTQYWAVLNDLFPEECIDRLYSETLPHLPHYYTDVSYGRGYDMLAYAKAGKVKEMWTFINRVFGYWKEQGNTRFPENFSIEAPRDRQLMFYGRPYGLSLCHGANGVPVVAGVLHGILGFEISHPNPKAYTFRPNLLHLHKVDADVPVKEGVIKLHLRSHGKSRVVAPKGCTVNILLTDGQTLKIHGKGTFRL